MAETKKVFLCDNASAETHKPGRSDAASGQNNVCSGNRLIERQLNFLHELIAVGEHHRHRYIFVSGGDEKFICNNRNEIGHHLENVVEAGIFL